MESYSRVRSIKLRRSTLEEPFGFGVCGGQEHGTGIFVSSVQPRSIAHRQGLKSGDQILRLNGYPLAMAIHRECLTLISQATSLHLKIRSVGMIPVRVIGEPLTWHLVESIHSASITDEQDDELTRRFESPALVSSTWEAELHGQAQEAKITIHISGESGLGCCICRGPAERPGIFVQSTKAGGVAREAGLRPGDQVLSCNGHSFTGIGFPEAVSHLKESKELRLVVIKGAASDLFPGESSGYNSSASSLNGETITTHVSVGSETSSVLSDARLHDVSRRSSRPSTADAEKTGNGVVLDRHMEWDEVENVWESAANKKESLVIEIRGEDPREKIRNEEFRLAEERRKLEEEQQRLLEEAKRFEEEKLKFEEEKRRVFEKGDAGSVRTSSTSSPDIPTPPPLRPDLAGALNNEIHKRMERRELQELQEQTTVGGQENQNILKNSNPVAPFTPPVDDVKREQHERLIEEFKRAHRKMFAHSQEEGKDEDKDEFPEREERASFRVKRIQKEEEHARKMVQNRVAGIVRQRQLRIERQHQEVQETEREVSKRVIYKGKSKPPPPLLPGMEEQKSSSVSQTRQPVTQFTHAKKFPLAPSMSHPTEKKLSNEEPIENVLRRRRQAEDEISSRPPSPSPDYSNTPSPDTPRRLKTFRNDKRLPKELEVAFVRCEVSSTNHGLQRHQKGDGRVLRNSCVPETGRMTQKTNSTGGILKNRNAGGSEHGSNSNSHHLKTITFGVGEF